MRSSVRVNPRKNEQKRGGEGGQRRNGSWVQINPRQFLKRIICGNKGGAGKGESEISSAVMG